MRTTVMAIVGGTASALGGGKFSNGAVSGAFVHMFNAEGFIRATLSQWKYGPNGRYKTWCVNGKDTGNSTNAPSEYYNGKSPGDRFFNGVGEAGIMTGRFVGAHPDDVGLALSIGAALTTGGLSWLLGGSALAIDVYQPDYAGVVSGGIAMILQTGAAGAVVDIGYGTYQAFFGD